jgi:hypothetical protein
MAEQEQGFKVTDRRSSTNSATEPEQQPETQKPEETAPPQAQPQSEFETRAEEPQPQPAEPAQDIPLPEANLLTLVFSLYTHTQICLGLLPDPVTQQPQKDLNQAKYNIDLIGVLQEKTKGNLSTEEAQTLESVLYEIRMAYVEANR